MTIAAGFRVRDGVLLCADTLFTGQGANLYSPKMRIAEFAGGKIVFTFSGNAELAQATIERCIDDLQDVTHRQIKANQDAIAIAAKRLDSEYRT